MARLDLERKIESLEEEIQFLRKIHEEVRPGGRREAHQVTKRKREIFIETETPTVRKKEHGKERVKTERLREMLSSIYYP